MNNKQLVELSDSEIITIVDLLKDAYKPGYQEQLVLTFAEFMVKKMISPISTIKIVKKLYESTKDNDNSFKELLTIIIYAYEKACNNIGTYAYDIESLIGINPCELEIKIDRSKVKSCLSLLEVLEKIVGREKALEILRKMYNVILDVFLDDIF